MIKIKKAIQIIEESNSFLLLCHASPDPDAAGSVIGLANALEQKNKKVSANFTGTINEQTRNLLVHAKDFVVEKPDYDVDCIIVLDTNSPALFDFNSVKKSRAKKIIIDHHSSKPEVIDCFDAAIIDEESVSVTQIIYYLLEELGTKLNHVIGISLSAGIVTDSANFIAATDDAFFVLSQLLKKSGVSFQTVLETINVKMDVSEKIARLKAAQRLQFIRFQDYLIVTSKVSAFEGSIANLLLSLGADVSFVAADHEGELRISSRAKTYLVKQGLHLGRDIMPKLINLIEGDAGGHAAAAGATGSKLGKMDEALENCVKETKKALANLN